MPDLSTTNPIPEYQLSEDQILDLLFLARTDEVSDFKSDVTTLSQRDGRSCAQVVAAARDPQTGNSAAHYAAANGHVKVLQYLAQAEQDGQHAVDIVGGGNETSSFGLFGVTNNQGSTPLHYAAVNAKQSSIQALLRHMSLLVQDNKVRDYVGIRNHAGRTAKNEAESQGQGREEWLNAVAILDMHETDMSEVDTQSDGLQGEGKLDTREVDEQEIEPSEGISKMALD